MADLDDLLLRTSRTFALSIPRLPEPTRTEVTVAYLLFRIADTFEDADGWPRRRRLTALRDFENLLARFEAPEPADSGPATAEGSARARARQLADSWTAGELPVGHAGYLDLLAASPEVLQAFAHLAPRARAAVARHTRRTAQGMAGFVARHDSEGRLQLEDLRELREYCYVVAGIVGEMLTELFLLAEPALEREAEALGRRAAGFGEALQLVNILKDATDDAREGRRYLPASVNRATVFGLARDDLKVATEYVQALQRAGAPRGMLAFTALPVQLAWGTLERVEAEGAGAKLGRDEVATLVDELEARLEADEPALAVTSTGTPARL